MAVERKEIDTKKIKECGLPLLWMLGGPGSGKSTQCVMLSKVKEMILISPEDLVNEQAEQATPRGHQISKAIEGKSWKALETPVIVDIVVEAIDYQLDNWFGNPEGKPKGIILDGFPNNLEILARTKILFRKLKKKLLAYYCNKSSLRTIVT